MSEWVKHAAEAATRWCSVLRRDRSAILTRCRGSLDECEPHQITERPAVADRCVACQNAYAAAELDGLAATCGDQSQRHTIEAGLRELITVEAIVPPAEGRTDRAALALLRDRYARQQDYVESADYVPGEDW